MFEWFAQARDSGYLELGGSLPLTGDAMTDYVQETLTSAEDGWFERYGEKWDRLCALWRHWSLYAKYDAMDPSEYV